MRSVLLACCLAVSLWSVPALAFDVFLNGIKVTHLKGADLRNCSVKFDGDGNIHIISPGYNVITDKDGNPRVTGTSDFKGGGASSSATGALKSRYVLVFRPHAKVSYSYEIYVNDKLFKKIAADQSAFTVELTQDLRLGNNSLRVIAKPTGGASGSETDTASLQVLKGTEEADGTFKAKRPAVWEMVRTGIDDAPIDRPYSIVAD
jgi:hypothetical protein